MPFELIADKLTWPVLGFLVLLIIFPGLVAMRSFRLFAAAKEVDWHDALPESAFWGTLIFVIACPFWWPCGLLPTNQLVTFFFLLKHHQIFILWI